MTISIKDIKAIVNVELKDIRDARKFAIKNGSIEAVKDCESKAIQILKNAISEIMSIEDKSMQAKVNYIVDVCTLCANYIDVEKLFAIRDDAVRAFMIEYKIERRTEASDDVEESDTDEAVNESDINNEESAESTNNPDVEESDTKDETVNESDETKKSNNEVFAEEDYTDEENRKRELWEDA